VHINDKFNQSNYLKQLYSSELNKLKREKSNARVNINQIHSMNMSKSNKDSTINSNIIFSNYLPYNNTLEINTNIMTQREVLD